MWLGGVFYKIIYLHRKYNDPICTGTQENVILNVDKSQQVFIVGDGSLFDSAVTRLVTFGTNLRVSHALYSDPPDFLDLINWDHLPGAILINESGSLNADHILGLVSTRIVSTEPVKLGTRIIIVHQSANVMDVYTHPVFVAGEMTGKPHRINVRSSNDLIDIVTSEYPY